MKKPGRMAILAFFVCLVVGVGCSTSDDRHDTFSLAGKVYSEKFTCNEVFAGSPTLSCPDLNDIDQIAFMQTSGNNYEVRDVPDSGFVMNGTMTGLTFQWTATSPNGYTETGTWTFSNGGGSFSGPSHYVADDASYSGDCHENGAIGIATPPDPPMPAGGP